MAATNFSGPVVSANGFATGSGPAAAGIISGAGAPTMVAPQGTLYLNTTGNSVSTRAYINTTGSNVWTAVTTAA